MRKAAVDIGTNSIRLLIDQGIGRRERVTGLGRGVDAGGELSEEAMARTVAVLDEYGAVIREHGVERIRAVATSATRDASNREFFLDQAERALGVRPECITGVEEARLAYAGAVADARGDGPFTVVDIGGGSTEFVTSSSAVSVDIGSVRLTERALPERPASFERVEAASRLVEGLMVTGLAATLVTGTVLGVAGTWTSIAGLLGCDPIHHAIVGRMDVDRLVLRLAALTVEQTALLSGLDPARAPVILGGVIVARQAMRHLAVDSVIVSEHDLLDGVIDSMA